MLPAYAPHVVARRVKQLGIQGEPTVEIVPVHALFTPAFKRV
jgi:hypothetical protein